MTDGKVPYTILAVDDTPENLDVINGVLSPVYKIKAAINGLIALKIAQATPPDLILLDVMMPEMDGYEVCRQLKSNPKTKSIPVIFVTAKAEEGDESEGFAVGAVDYILKPVSPSLLKARVEAHLAIYHQKRILEETVAERTRELSLTNQHLISSQKTILNTRKDIIHILGRASEFKDNDTGHHVIRMSHYAKLIGIAYGMSEESAELLFLASQMHDIGKIGIPDDIITKPGKLNAEEWEHIQRHPEIGADIIGVHDVELLRLARTIAITHHEKWNGKGYPKGLKESEIPLEGRIVAIADVFDALTSLRPYKSAWTVEKAAALIESESGEHFDPHLTILFLDIISDIVKIKEQFSDHIAS